MGYSYIELRAGVSKPPAGFRRVIVKVTAVAARDYHRVGDVLVVDLLL